MKDSEDPFMSVINFLDKKTPKSVEWSHKIERAWDALNCNIIMIAYLFAAALTILLITTPILISSENQTLINLGGLMHVSSGVLQICHQLPYRSIIINSVPLPVCARDVGIYLGAVAGFATILAKKRHPLLSKIKLPLHATIPIALDGVTQTILLLRESNNTLRLITGFIFSFGLVAYAANKIILKKYPLFRQSVTTKLAIVADAAAVILILNLALMSLASEISIDYMGKHEAIQKAISETNPQYPGEVRAYYVNPSAPQMMLADPYYENHKQTILTELIQSPWNQPNLTLITTQSNNLTGKTTEQTLLELSSQTHKFGIWVVAVPNNPPKPDELDYIWAGTGKYILFDALTHDKITEKNL